MWIITLEKLEKIILDILRLEVTEVANQLFKSVQKIQTVSRIKGRQSKAREQEAGWKKKKKGKILTVYVTDGLNFAYGRLKL